MNSPQQDASRLRSPAWVALPDDDDDEAVQVGREASSISSTVWWLGTTMVMLAAMLLLYCDGAGAFEAAERRDRGRPIGRARW